MTPQKNKNCGFTLIEMVLILVIVALLASVVVPPSLTFFQTERLNSVSREFFAMLKRAQTLALSQERDSAYGVYLAENQYTLFKGESFELRDSNYDEDYLWPRSIDFQGMSEVLFLKLSGLPEAAGEIRLSNGFRSNIIRINSEGLITCDLNVAITTP